jgi:hypothetical protein
LTFEILNFDCSVFRIQGFFPIKFYSWRYLVLYAKTLIQEPLL